MVFATYFFSPYVFRIYPIFTFYKEYKKKYAYNFPKEGSWSSIFLKSYAELDRIVSLIKKRGYHLEKREPDLLIFVKNSFSKWGTFIFHLGLFILILAGFMALGFQKRGYVELIEGDLFSGKHTDFFVTELGIFQKRFDLRFKTYLAHFFHEYGDKGEVKELKSYLLLVDERGNRYKKKLSVGQPVIFQGVNIYQSWNYGYTVSFILEPENQEKIVSHFMLNKAPNKPYFEGFFDYPNTKYFFKFVFYPNIEFKSLYLKNPKLFLQIFDGNKMIYQGQMKLGDIIFFNKNRLHFFNVSMWSGLIFVQGIDVYPAYIGFIITSIGIILLYLFPYQVLFLRIKDNQIFLSYGAQKFSLISKSEFDKIKKELANLCGV